MEEKNNTDIDNNNRSQEEIRETIQKLKKLCLSESESWMFAFVCVCWDFVPHRSRDQFSHKTKFQFHAIILIH